MIKFGTDGWRARVAEEFTFSNVRLVAQAVINYIKEIGLGGKPFVLGYDNRFLSEHYAMEAARVAAAAGIDCRLSGSSLPSPALSFAVKHLGAGGGIMITASHNPPEYNGLKFKASYAGSASPDMTAEVERHLKQILGSDAHVKPAPENEKKIKYFDPKRSYFEELKKFVDFKLIAAAGLRIIADPMHGSAAGYLKEILASEGIPSEEIRSNRDPLFGGQNPEPLPQNLDELTSLTRETSLREPDNIVVGIATDGDGDRIGAVGSSGAFISPHLIFSILLKHLVENKKMKGEVVKTFNITNLIPLLAKKYGLPLHETPIGFKYICDLMQERDILIGGEESGGIGIKGHIPERDSTLAALLLLEAVATWRKSLDRIVEGIMDELGHFYYNRADLHLADEKKSRVFTLLKKTPPDRFGGLAVKEIRNLDGIKFLLEDGSWILFRASGTEPLLRIYCEATSPDLLMRILGEGEKIAQSA